MTCYVRNDPVADITGTGQAIGAKIFSVDPGFGEIGHPGPRTVLHWRSEGRNGCRGCNVPRQPAGVHS